MFSSKTMIDSNVAPLIGKIEIMKQLILHSVQDELNDITFFRAQRPCIKNSLHRVIVLTFLLCLINVLF